MQKNYSKNISGLRAIAVISVVIFHLFPKGLAGGYLGVDIFFVISGFLITGILLKEKEKTNKINILNFYKKRMLRILPATLVMLLVASILAYYTLATDVLINYAKSLAYSIVGSANIYFKYNLDTSYFAPSVNTNLLLHLWSLGVEWQYYLIFPFIILFCPKKYLFKLLIFLFLASIVSAQIISKNNQMFGYYMLLTRGFELLIGGIGAFLVLYKKEGLSNFLKNNVLRSTLGLLAIILIIFSLFVIGENYKLPNIYTLLAILPALVLLLIGAVEENDSNKSLINKILSIKVLELIGLWSFSIYLYHWVIISLYHNVIGNEVISLKVGVIIMLASVVLGATSYYLIEKPMLKVKWHVAIVFLVLVIIPFGLSKVYRLYFLPNLANKISYEIDKIDKNYKNTCFYDSKNFNVKELFLDKCIVNKQNGEPNILLLGDSNGLHYFAVFKMIAEKLKFSLRNELVSSCRPLVAKNIDMIKYIGGRDKKGCANFNSKVISNHYFMKNYDVVILSALWLTPKNEGITDKEYIEILDNTIKEIRKTAKLIVIIAASPEPEDLNVRAIVAGNFILKDRANNNLNTITNEKITQVNNLIKSEASKYKNIYFVEGFRNVVCNEKKCKYKQDKKSLYRDVAHYSVYGEEYIAKRYIEKGIEPVWYKVKNLYKNKTK